MGKRASNVKLKFEIYSTDWLMGMIFIQACRVQNLKASAWIIYFRWIVKNSTVMHVGGNFYVICHFDFDFQHSNFNIHCPHIWDEMNAIYIQACRVHNSWKKLIKKILPYIHNCFCIIDTWVHESSIFVVGKKILQSCKFVEIFM